MVYCSFCKSLVSQTTRSLDHMDDPIEVCDVCDSTDALRSDHPIHRAIVADTIRATRMLLEEYRAKTEGGE